MLEEATLFFLIDLIQFLEKLKKTKLLKSKQNKKKGIRFEGYLKLGQFIFLFYISIKNLIFVKEFRYLFSFFFDR